MSKANNGRKNIVVVGGGGAGSAVSRFLSDKLDPTKHNLILINPRPFRLLLIPSARYTVSNQDHLDDQVCVPFDKNFHNGNGTLLVGKVVSIDEDESRQYGHVALANGERILYHYLVLATGAIWEGPLAFPDDPAEVTSFIAWGRENIRKAKHIALVGGGAVGVEFAGEIKDIWPDTKVTIVQGDKLLLNKTYPDKFRKSLERRVRARGIDIIFNDYIDDIPQPGVIGVMTRNGKTLNTDLVLQTRGPRPNTEFIASLSTDALTPSGLVKVQPTLQLASHPNIFAAGDIIDVAEQKQLAKAAVHASIIADNIYSLLTAQPLKNYKGSTEMILVTVGRGGGAGYFDFFWGIIVGNWVARLLKSKTLMVERERGMMGY